MKTYQGKLERILQTYSEGKQYPFCMPGHKRHIQVTSAVDSSLDFTETADTDDLHHAENILKEAMDNTARMYGAEKTWYLVNGSTCGNLAGISALTKEGDEVIAARNCHRSVYHAMQLRNLRVHWLLPPYIRDYEIYGSLTVKAVEDALNKYPKTKAVILTSPTYEGVISDIQGIARVCHARNIPVFVDEAHGAHLSFGSFPTGAVKAGADLTVQSPHKTLFSVTQTAWLHAQGNLVRKAEVEKQLGIFETSSPSYPMMMSLDGCTRYWQENEDSLMHAWEKMLREFGERTSDLRHLKILSQHWQAYPDIYAYDPGKILVQGPVSGKAMLRTLHDTYGFTMEMALGHHVLAMTSAADDRQKLIAFADALKDMDRKTETEEDLPTDLGLDALPHARMSIHDGIACTHEAVSWSEAAGRTAGEYAFVYPPGIPLAVPGEVITGKEVRQMELWQSEGYEIRTSESAEKGQILVVK